MNYWQEEIDINLEVDLLNLLGKALFAKTKKYEPRVYLLK